MVCAVVYISAHSVGATTYMFLCMITVCMFDINRHSPASCKNRHALFASHTRMRNIMNNLNIRRNYGRIYTVSVLQGHVKLVSGLEGRP